MEESVRPPHHSADHLSFYFLLAIQVFSYGGCANLLRAFNNLCVEMLGVRCYTS